MSQMDWFLLSILGVLGLTLVPYVCGPLLIMKVFKLKHPTRIVFFDAETLQLPDEVAGYLVPTRDRLEELGFQPIAYFYLPDVVQNVKSILVLLANVRSRDTATINCTYAKSEDGHVTKTKYVEFYTVFRDGTHVGTNNTTVVGAFRQPENHHQIHFWDIKDIGRLYQIHRRICDELSTSERVLRLHDDFDKDVEEYIETAVLQEPMDYQVECGLMWRVPDGYRLTFKGAMLFTWNEMWPGKPLRRITRGRIAKRWLAEIGG